MKGFWKFIKENRHLLLFGVMLTFFSSIGQTFLISLYIPRIEDEFGFTNTEISSLYAIATMASAFSLPWAGRLVDTWPLRKFSFAVLTGIVIACLIMWTAVHPVMILAGFFCLRFFGQGLMTHTSVSTMARAFEVNRGKAISIATLGHPLGEAILPVIVAIGIGAFGWQSMFALTAGLVIVIVAPSVYHLLKVQKKDLLYPNREGGSQEKASRNPFLVLKSRAFWVIAPVVFILGYLNTAIFFFQVKLGTARGWDPEWVAGSLSAFAIASALGMTISGPVVDKMTARKLFPFILIPYLIGIAILAEAEHRFTYPAALVLLALSNGGGSTIKNSLFAEIFGIKIIGSVRSVFTTVMVFSTALGPVTFGILLDAGFSFARIFWFSAGAVGLIIIWSFTLRRK